MKFVGNNRDQQRRYRRQEKANVNHLGRNRGGQRDTPNPFDVPLSVYREIF